MRTKLKNNSHLLAVAGIAFLAGTLLQFAHAWTEPSVAPPNATIGAPITIGADQNKAGSFGTSKSLSALGAVSAGSFITAGTSITAGSSITSPKYCIGASCITSWPTATGGDNLGNHTATQPLNMSGNAINSVGSVNYSDGSSQNSKYVSGGLYGICMVQSGAVCNTPSQTAKAPATSPDQWSCSCPSGFTAIKTSQQNPTASSLCTITYYSCYKN